MKLTLKFTIVNMILLAILVSIAPFEYLLFSYPKVVQAQSDNLWASHGPEGGNAWALVFSPDYINDQTVFAGFSVNTHSGPDNSSGLFRTTDGGNTWVDMGLSNQLID